jgi:hypothetical protein
MTTHATVQDWLDRYVAAWNSYDPAAIAALFSPDCAYRYRPSDDPVIGEDAIVESWLGDPDQAGTYDAEYHPFAVDANRAVATGWSRYWVGTDQTEVREVYDNCFLIEFDDAGRCKSFTEWFMRRSQP